MPLLLDTPFTPRARREDAEALDDPSCDPALRERSIRDVTRANRLLGGTRAVLAEFRAALPALRALRREVTVLDVGTGLGDIPVAMRALAAHADVRVRAVGLDGAATLVRSAARRLDDAVCGDALHLPLADASVDVVTCSQVLHHFTPTDAVALLREMSRVARVCAIVSDLRRNWLAAGGLWLVSYPMRFHPVSREDGMLSVLKGFTGDELAALVRRAGGGDVRVTHRLGWRLTARWTPAGSRV